MRGWKGHVRVRGMSDKRCETGVCVRGVRGVCVRCVRDV